jgi:hypothetical protein
MYGEFGMTAKTRMALVLGCLVSVASLAQVTGGAVSQTTTDNTQLQPIGQLKTGGVLRQAPVDSQPARQSAVPQVPTGPQTQQQNPQVQQIPQQQLNAPAERKGRNQKDDKSFFGGLI